MRRLALSLVVAFTLAGFTSGCGDDDGTVPGTDSGPAGADSGPGGGTDAGPGGGADSGPDAPDAGPGTDLDAGPAPVGCANDFAGCATYMDLTGMSAVSITTGPGFVYAPKCVRVSAGTMVTIAGSTSHPLTKAPCSPAGTELDTLGATGSVTGATVTFAAEGNYGIYCMNHGTSAGGGMAASIQVVP